MLTNDVIALNSAAPSDILTALPGTAIDGQVIYYNADSTNGVVWQLRYRSASASAYKWEFVGGSPLVSTVIASESTTSTSFTDLATVGPSITVPLAGDYDVEIGGYTNSSGASVTIQGFAVGASSATDGESTRGNANQGNPRMRYRKTGIAASTIIRMKYKVAALTGSWDNRQMLVYPVRVG